MKGSDPINIVWSYFQNTIFDKVKIWFPAVIRWIKLRFTEIGAAPALALQFAKRSPLCLIAVIIGLLLLLGGWAAVIISYVRSFKKKEPDTPFIFTAYLLVTFFVLWLSRLLILGYHTPLPQTVTVSGEELIVYDQYSLCRADERGTIITSLDPVWKLRDDTVTWKVEDDLILQLTGVNSISRSYALRVMQHEPADRIFLDYLNSYQTENMSYTKNAYLALFIFPGMQLNEQPWYIEGGENVAAESVIEFTARNFTNGTMVLTGPEAEYTVLENRGDMVIFALPYFLNYPDPYIALCYAAQIGDNVVIGASYGSEYSHHMVNNEGRTRIYDPLGSTDDLDFLEGPLKDLFSGRIRLISDPDGAAAKLIFPSRITNYPSDLKSVIPFSFPCSELIDMCAAGVSTPEVSYDLSVIRFIADGPDGKAHTWSLANGGDIYRSISARYKFKNSGDWAEAYKDGRKDPDSDMSEWVGATAVAFDDGWLIISGKLDEGKTQFYYLTMTD